MTYFIHHKDSKVFDIELYMKQSNDKKTNGQWYSEINVGGLVPSGSLSYVFEEIKTEEQLKEFAVDCNEICELRGWIYEWHNNFPKDFEEAIKDHNEVVVPHIESVLKKFCDKYGFFMHTD